MTQFHILALVALISSQLAGQPEGHTVKNLKITILSTMLAQKDGVGEWGFSAFIEADSNKLLFDAGGRERTVLENARELHVSLTDVPTLILSHWHDDHTAGWLALRTSVQPLNKNALAFTHVAPGFFDTRVSANGTENNDRRKDSIQYIRTGGGIIEHKSFEEVFPGVYLTGLVPRKYPEKNYPAGNKMKDVSGMIVEDNIPEDMSLVIQTEKGLVLLSGCGHAGIINTITHVQQNLPGQPLLAVIGGFHLFQDTDEEIKWTAEQLKKCGLRYFMGAHCTGIEPVYQIREWVGLKRGECIVGSVGATFDLDNGFASMPLTK